VWVVKLGGSLASGAHLGNWLRELAAHGRGRAVLVPGGGPFADAVRASQQRWRFSDLHAHRMAILAMRQFGLMLAGIEPALTEAPSVAAVKRVLRDDGIPVWLPDPDELDAAGILPSWDITSDSLAAWLAGALGAPGLLLVKSRRVEPDAPLEHLIRESVVDSALPGFLRRAGCTPRVMHAEDSARLEAILAKPLSS
jgi:aspartokinase-like uncharacterized kinase